ncbi:MAG: BREX-1 system phosphatase PglZ type A [Tepidisphaeraceae bacterium]
MTSDQLESALRKKFETSRVVFWNDPDREFYDLVSGLFFLSGVKVLRLDQLGSFEAKLRIEHEDPEAKYLVYAPSQEPEYDADWLLDVRLYSESFRADRASIVLSELGLTQPSLRGHLQARRKFFDAKERTKRLQPLIVPNDTEADLDRKMIAVLTRAEQPDLFVILRTVFHAFWEEAEGGEIDLAETSAVWEQVVKYDLEEPFWAMVKQTFGYAEASPTLQNLAIRLLVTDLAHHLGDQAPSGLSNLVLPRPNRANVVVCLAQWRDSASKSASYDRISGTVAKIVKLADHVGTADIEHLLDVMTFLDAEKAIISGLRDRVLSTKDTVNIAEVREIATRRQSGHWASEAAVGDKSVPRQALHQVYDALVAAAQFFELRNRHASGFDFADATAMYAAYENDLHGFDQLYRHFCEFADAAERQGWNLLKSLQDEVEAVYVNWFLPTLALAWGKHVEPSPGTGLLAKWQIGGVRNQYSFYREAVEQPLKGGEYKRLFVIVSDALRYEAAAELTRDLNGKYRFEADLSSMLSVLPSYTAHRNGQPAAAQDARL